MRTSNPTLTAEVFRSQGLAEAGDRMTIEGAVTKTSFLLFLVAVPAAAIWNLRLSPAGLMGCMLLGTLGGFILAIATVFAKRAAPITAPFYAIFEGLAMGGISLLFEARYPGIVPQALAITFGTLLALLVAYRSGLIRATENFKLGVFAATGGICLVYLAGMILSLFGISFPLLHGGGPIGILVSLFVCVVAALNLVLDFDFIEQGAQEGAPKYMEWYAAFGLMVTLIWLYLEVLRLLSKMRSRD